MDVSKQKQMETALVRSEKLAATGRLAATIAHEINNPLEAITNLTYLLSTTLQDETLRSYVPHQTLTGFSSEIRQVISNLLVNAMRHPRLVASLCG